MSVLRQLYHQEGGEDNPHARCWQWTQSVSLLAMAEGDAEEEDQSPTTRRRGRGATLSDKVNEEKLAVWREEEYIKAVAP